ncbi:MAG TPA: carboxylating nicotinate-nucleotide diphosphorylase [Thermoplasmata archaeon]|nr:carboxylating nicotinate-nucleotide diphosphorylase [Thermoplasmata archaeon]
MTTGRRRRDRPIDRLVRTALAEDRVDRDRTTRALLPGPVRAVARVSAQARGTLSGMEAARAIAHRAGLTVRRARRDGDRIRPGSVVLELRGDARRILSVERTLLNFLMHASGVATATADAVARGGPLAVWGTRKTLPGLRDLEKAAVGHGGGVPHRRDLAAALLVKNNHLALVPLPEAVRRARAAAGPGEPVEVEVRSARDAVRAARAGADVLLLDNQRPAAARSLVRALVRAGVRRGRRVELSGGITPATIRRYRGVGADRASLGALTHSAAAVPFHLTLRPAALRRRSG